MLSAVYHGHTQHENGGQKQSLLLLAMEIQRKIILEFVSGCDVFVSQPTGLGSMLLCFALDLALTLHTG